MHAHSHTPLPRNWIHTHTVYSAISDYSRIYYIIYHHNYIIILPMKPHTHNNDDRWRPWWSNKIVLIYIKLQVFTHSQRKGRCCRLFIVVLFVISSKCVFVRVWSRWFARSHAHASQSLRYHYTIMLLCAVLWFGCACGYCDGPEGHSPVMHTMPILHAPHMLTIDSFITLHSIACVVSVARRCASNRHLIAGTRAGCLPFASGPPTLIVHLIPPARSAAPAHRRPICHSNRARAIVAYFVALLL